MARWVIDHGKFRRGGGFTLVEVLIVVVILGVLAAIVTPSFAQAAEGAKRAAFASELERLTRFAMLYVNQEGVYPEDSSSGVMPEGFEKWLKPSDWESGTPIGGVWDMEYDSFGVTSAVGVHFNGVEPPADAYMVEIDGMMDDGDLEGGSFIQLAEDRFYNVVEW